MADFGNFWHAKSRNNLTLVTMVLATHLDNVATLPCEIQKSKFGRFQQ